MPEKKPKVIPLSTLLSKVSNHSEIYRIGDPLNTRERCHLEAAFQDANIRQRKKRKKSSMDKKQPSNHHRAFMERLLKTQLEKKKQFQEKQRKTQLEKQRKSQLEERKKRPKTKEAKGKKREKVIWDRLNTRRKSCFSKQDDRKSVSRNSVNTFSFQRKSAPNGLQKKKEFDRKIKLNRRPYSAAACRSRKSLNQTKEENDSEQINSPQLDHPVRQFTRPQSAHPNRSITIESGQNIESKVRVIYVSPKRRLSDTGSVFFNTSLTEYKPNNRYRSVEPGKNHSPASQKSKNLSIASPKVTKSPDLSMQSEFSDESLDHNDYNESDYDVVNFEETSHSISKRTLPTLEEVLSDDELIESQQNFDEFYNLNTETGKTNQRNKIEAENTEHNLFQVNIVSDEFL